ncbi:Chromosomal replication initiator protein DnaA [Mycoplasmopsis meleagridis]|uniref:Chromosomal replication initiator protein DnaA n=1 Tax=Mycoplasmopsis meleagridis ATCC 25294 TaxID=1264554 RepID=A0A0F5H0H0_9BACT|nr:chromosomal replication initiator protein DnaA [Mycoplasmopsis meleagridis]KKB26698.1 Chromosomal replication initiator protein DnaA [Mycoplasmopsis meleagridis ATCC 25294]OAD18186.1 Chromosomal replication initiator protein DnaA [Mycoplasmopsis meleagridis]VEU77230.1 chromosomal replication initiator protein DnaA [Mycoplasmopsis meleagridis]
MNKIEETKYNNLHSNRLMKELKLLITDSFIFKNYFSKIKVAIIKDKYIYLLTNKNKKENIDVFNEYKNVFNEVINSLFPDHKYKFIWNEDVDKYKDKNINKEDNIITYLDIRKDHTFENYVEGKFNHEAIKICKMIINGEKNFNPVLIYGKSGLGKTHLLHATINQLLKDNVKVMYINPSIFVREVSSLLQENNQAKIKKMKKALDEIDILMFDDLQSLTVGNKRSTLNLLFTILDERINKQRVTIFTLDKPIDLLIEALDNRLYTRLAMGLQQEIKSPSQEELAKILISILKENNMNPENWDKDAISLITQNFASDVRNLIGGINKIKFHKSEIDSSYNSQYSLSIVKNILSSINKDQITVSPDKIIHFISKYYKINMNEIINKNREKNVVLARNIAIYIIREQLKLPLDKIGSIFGNRDHSTIINSIKNIEKQLKEVNNNLNQTIAEIKDSIYRLK